MINIDLIRNNPEEVKNMLLKRKSDFDLQAFIMLDNNYREALLNLEELQSKRNQLSKGNFKDPKIIEEAKMIKSELIMAEDKASKLDEERKKQWALIPNMLDKRVPQGNSDKDNVEIKKWGEPRQFNFEPKWHDELATNLDIIGIKQGIKVCQSGFLYWKGDGARLHSAMFNFALDTFIKRGFTLFTTPILAKEETFFGTGYLPFAQDQLYTTNENLSLIGTSEQTLVAYHMNDVIELENGPLMYTAQTPCFRTEAGSYGKETRGVFRVHQFNKVEQIIFCQPEESVKWHNFCLENEEYLFQQLNIPYHVVNVCTGDLGAPASMKYDIEGWFPGYGGYRELTSNSNLLDYQTRRLQIRTKINGQTVYPHTISATGITERALLAILENNQNEDGSISIPEVLRPYMSGQEKIVKKG